MWSTIPYIVTPISLLAFGLAILAVIKRAKIKADIDRLNGVEGEQKAKLLATLEYQYHLDTDRLSQYQVF
ncbi:MAG: hypothetical protein JNL72_06475, partial [Flavipsychrobacter sp.]|nr:hypothetical protein [Flavipsychrobacter sp.]